MTTFPLPGTMPAGFVLPQQVFGTAVTASTDTSRPASGTRTDGQTQVNKSADAAPVVPMDWDTNAFHEMSGEGAVFQPESKQDNGRPKQHQQNYSQNELDEFIHLGYQLVPLKDGKYPIEGMPSGPTFIVQTSSCLLIQLPMEETVQHSTASPTLITAFTPAKKPKISGVKLENCDAVEMEDGSSVVETGKRYQCHLCPYAAYRKDHLTRHSLIHSGEKPYQCFICFKQFYRADHCKKHFDRIHRETPYDLPWVTKTVVERDDWKADRNLINSTTAGMPPTTLPLQHHPRAVTETAAYPSSGSENKDEKCFACNYCTWRGEYNWALKRHLATHIKPFRCPFCDYSTGRKYRLVAHVRKRHTK